MIDLGELKRRFFETSRMYVYKLTDNEVSVVFAKDEQEALKILKETKSNTETDEQYIELRRF